jgi:serine/threonine protein kinase/predicted Zn-dependent protease
MNPDRWQRVKRMFDAALKLPPGERTGYLVDACDGDDDLRREVESLLDSFDEAQTFMERPAVGEVADQIVASQVTKFSRDQTVAHYQIVFELGAGGQGTVYKALDTKLGRTVALKLLPPELTAVGDTSRKRFQREAQLASSLDHPNICTVHDLMEVNGAVFIVMQFVEGRNIRQLVKGRPLEIRSALKIAIQVCDALAAAHSRGIIHRDIKAHNIIVSKSGQAKILDFGLAKLIMEGGDGKDQTELTALGSPYGTPTYAAPEQSRGEKVDHRADIFSTGVLLYELLAGTCPFQGKTAIDVRHAVLYDNPKPISEKRGSSIPAALEAIVSRALSKDQAGRYQQISRMRDELIEVLRQLPEGRETSTESFLEGFKSAKLRHLPRLNRKVFAAGVVALSFAVAILAYVLYLGRPVSTLTSKDTILITDFANTTGDAVFDETLKQGLAIELQQSPFLNIFPDTRVRETLRRMERATDERVTVEIGREICQRNDLKALIAGSIAAFGSHYVINLEAINARSGEAIARQQTEAASKEEVLKSLSSAASGIREKLGESLSSIQASDIPLYQLTTPSLEALQSFALGFELSNRGEYFESIPLFRRATELDPSFAYGYSLLAGNYTIINEAGRAAENAAKAFALKDRVSEREKLYITNVYYDYTLGDLDKTIEVLGVYRQSYPGDFRPAGNMSLAYLLLGQFDKSIEAARESLRLNPNISAWRVTLGTALLRLNHYDESRQVFADAIQQGLDDIRFHAGLFAIAAINDETAEMQNHIDWARGKPDEYAALDWQTSAMALAGKWRQAEDLSQRSIDLASRSNVRGVAASYAALQALRAASIGRYDTAAALAAQSLRLEHNQVSLPRAALALALCGQLSQAQSLIDEMTRQYDQNTLINGLWLPVIRAALEMIRQNPSGAIEKLQSVLRYETAGEFWPKYIRGRAYLKMNRGAEAAAEFQQILDHRGQAPLSILYSLARRGLADATAMSGDKATARKLYEDFFVRWKDADSDLPVLIEAQKSYASLKGR